MRTRDLGDPDRFADRHAIDPQPGALAVVRLDEHADREAASVVWDDPGGRPDAALELVADHPRPPADIALRDGSGRCRGQCRTKVLGPDMEAVDVVEETVVGLAHDRKRPMVRPGIGTLDRNGHERVADDPDAVRVGDRHRARELAGLADPLETGHLAVAVQAVAARVHRFVPAVVGPRHDDRHSRPDRSTSHDERSVALDDRGVADSNAGHVRDGVAGTRPSPADDDPKVADAHRAMLAVPPGASLVSHAWAAVSSKG